MAARYLMVVVGSLYIHSGQAPARDILRDLVELCKGVQHPTRGLFLRYVASPRSEALVCTHKDHQAQENHAK